MKTGRHGGAAASAEGRLRSWVLKRGAFFHSGLRVALGGLFLYSGVRKAIDLPDAGLAVHGYALVPGFLVHPVALGVTLLEITLGTLLLLGLRTRFAAAAITTLSVLFLVVLVQAKVRGLDISCGCFGGNGAGKGVGWLELVRELPILAAAIYLLAGRTPGTWTLDRLLVVGRGLEKELRIGIPLVLISSVTVAALVVPGLTGLVDLPQAAAADQVSVSGPARSTTFPAGSTLPDFTAPALYGGTVSWRTYRGAPAVLVIWAAWCPDCRAEVPLVAQVMSQFSGVRLVSIATAAGQVPGPTPEQFMQSHDLSFPVALDTVDDRLSDALGTEAFPTIYYVRADGIVSKATVGATPEAVVRSAIQAITE